MIWILAVPFVLAVLVAILICGPRKTVEYECDLCGLHVTTKEWASSKAAACHVCDSCAEIEAQSARFYAAMDRKRRVG
jgi:hypothetical protein